MKALQPARVVVLAIYGPTDVGMVCHYTIEATVDGKYEPFLAVLAERLRKPDVAFQTDAVRDRWIRLEGGRR